MFTRVAQMMQQMMASFQQGDLPQAVSWCDFPMALRLGGRDLLLTRPDELITLLADLADQRRAAGQVSSTAELMSIELPRRGRFRVWTRWHHVDADGRPADHTDMIYHCRDRGHRICIEAAEVTRLSLDAMQHYPHRQRFTV